MLTEEHRRLIRSGLSILARALEPPHEPPHESATRSVDVEPTRLAPPLSPVAAAPIQSVQPAPAAPEPVTLAPPAPIRPPHTAARVVETRPAPRLEPESAPLFGDSGRAAIPAPAQSFFRAMPWSGTRAQATGTQEPASPAATPTAPEVRSAPHQAAAGGYFQAVFRRQAVDVAPAPATQPGRTERAESAAEYFSTLPWRPATRPPASETAPPLGLSAAIMGAATRSALQSAERLAQSQRPPVAATSYFQSLPWRSRSAADSRAP